MRVKTVQLGGYIKRSKPKTRLIGAAASAVNPTSSEKRRRALYLFDMPYLKSGNRTKARRPLKTMENLQKAVRNLTRTDLGDRSLMLRRLG